MNYNKRFQMVKDFIGQHLDEELTLEQLSSVSCFSVYHFHRLFTAFSGMSVGQYVKWLRLKRAAHQLIVQQQDSIIDIAIAAGFESHEAFSRAFKKACGLSPSEFRSRCDWSFWETIPYQWPKQQEQTMNVTIKTFAETRLAAIEHRGDPNLVANSVNRLIEWAKAQPIDLKPKPGEAFMIAPDDPKTTAPDEFCCDLAITIPKSLKLSGEVVEKILPAGRYATVMHEGSHSRLGETVYPVYQKWLPQSGEEFADLPCVFCYYNFEHEVAETELKTECRFLLKD